VQGAPRSVNIIAGQSPAQIKVSYQSGNEYLPVTGKSGSK